MEALVAGCGVRDTFVGNSFEISLQAVLTRYFCRQFVRDLSAGSSYEILLPAICARYLCRLFVRVAIVSLQTDQLTRTFSR
eukprot:6020846-Pleurochrysis_carterae.AAC.1